MSKVRLGAIGAGMISHSFGKSIAGHGEAEFTAAHDPHAERLAELCDKFDVPRRHAEVEDLFADDGVDAIYVAVPNKFHAPLAKRALEAGKHVILDKPFALSAEEAQTVVDAAKASGKTFTLGMNQRFPESHQRARALVESGQLGEVYHARAVWRRRSGIPKLGTWFGNKEVAGGGAMLDIGVHLLDLAMHLTGRFDPVAVSGQVHTIFGHRGLGEGMWGASDPADITFDVDDNATALIRFAGGMSIQLDVTWAAHQAERNVQEVELFGSDAGATAVAGQWYRFQPKGAPKEDYRVEPLPEGPLAYPHKDRFHNFVNHLLGREALMTPIDQALAVQKTLDAIYESSRTGRQVEIR
ncbi:MAG: Gfo/Idh/MocA family oxidoreductase [Planctomycetota bacterium]